MFAFLGTMQAKIIGGLLVVAAIGWLFLHVYGKGETAGGAKITTAVQSKTIETINKARTAKEKADADVRSKPYDQRVDDLK
jgi:hypothetical protein